MMRRRSLSFRVLVMAVLVALAAAGEARAEQRTGGTEALVRKKIDEVLGILRDPARQGMAKRQERHRAILAVANTIFDWDEMARRSLGAPWR